MKLFKKVFPLLVIAIVWTVLFWPFLSKALLPIPADIITGVYYPWLDYKWGYSVEVPVKNPFISDSISQFYPFKIYAIELIKKGIFPLWNSSMFARTRSSKMFL